MAGWGARRETVGAVGEKVRGPCDVCTLPSPSRPSLDRSPMVSDPIGAGFQASSSSQAPGYDPPPWFRAEPATYGQGDVLPGPNLGLGGLDSPWTSVRMDGVRREDRGRTANWEELEEAELEERNQWLIAEEANLQSQNADIQQKRRDLWYQAETLTAIAREANATLLENEEQEQKIQHKQVSLYLKEREITDLEKKVQAQVQAFEKRCRDTHEEHQEVQRQLNDLQQKEKTCEDKLSAVRAAMDRLQNSEKEVEARAKQFDEEKRKLENHNAIYKTEIRRLKYKLDQMRKIDREIIPVGHDGAGSFLKSQPPDRPAPNIASLPTPASPYPPPPPTMAPGMTASDRVLPPPPAGRGQILDATWGPPQQPQPRAPPGPNGPAPL